MKNFIYITSLVVFCISCAKKEKTNFNITGKIIGLKKGTVYLEKIDIDTIMVIDSIILNEGIETFSFSNNIKEPDLFAISLNKSDTKIISFFAEPGNINIETELSKFIEKAKISGSKQQALLKKHDDYVRGILFKNLDLTKEKFIALKDNDLNKVDEITKKYNQNIKRMYLFSVNYAINNSSNHVAAYIAATKMDKITPKFKEKVYEALTTEVKESKYGLLLKQQLN